MQQYTTPMCQNENALIATKVTLSVVDSAACGTFDKESTGVP